MTNLPNQESASVALWQGEQHKRIFSELQKSLSHKKSCIVITGSKGVGKSAIINQFVKEQDENTQSLVITGAQDSELDFYSSIASGFGVGTRFGSKVQFLVEFGNYLYRCNEEKKKVMLVIDDCHLLAQPFLEIIRQIANIENDGKRLLHLFLVGDTVFDRTLNYSRNRALRFSLAMREKVVPFSLKDTAEYVNFRLESVGCTEKVFCLKGIEIVHKASRGLVRDINTLCEHVLARTELSGGGIAVELTAIYESVEQLGLDDEIEEKPISIEVPEQRQAENKVLYQSPEIEDFPEEKPFGDTDTDAGDLAHPEEKKKRPAVWLGILALVVCAGAGFWWYEGQQKLKLERQQLLAAGKDSDSKIVVPVVQPTKDFEKIEPVVTVPAEVQDIEQPTETVKKVAAQSENKVVNVVEQADPVLPEQPILPGLSFEDSSESVPEKIVQEEKPEVSVTELVKDAVAVEEVVAAPSESIHPTQPVEDEPLVISEDEPVAVVSSQQPPLTKSEPAVEPLQPIVDDPSAEEQLAMSLDSENLVKDEVVPPAVKEEELIPELEAVSKKRVETSSAKVSDESFIFRLKPGSSELTDYGKKQLKLFVEQAKSSPGLPIQVRGYVSSDNDTDENRELSRKRAIEVYKMLLDEGIEFTRLQVVGMGIENPIASNATPQGRYKNRRVEVEFIKDNN